MIVGFTITDFKGHEKEAVEFIKRICILEDTSIADNIVSEGPGINIFSSAVTKKDLESQPFRSVPIETQDGKYLLVSAVNFNIELLYNGTILKLLPTEYTYIDEEEVQQFFGYIKQGLVKIIPEMTKDGKLWILDDGNWNDNGIWVDNDYWRDTNE